MTAVIANALTLDPDPVQFPAIHYVFIEKHGNIPANVPQAWNELHLPSRPTTPSPAT